jgi:hypothetical protein
LSDWKNSALAADIRLPANVPEIAKHARGVPRAALAQLQVGGDLLDRHMLRA